MYITHSVRSCKLYTLQENILVVIIQDLASDLTQDIVSGISQAVQSNMKLERPVWDLSTFNIVIVHVLCFSYNNYRMTYTFSPTI